MADASGSQIPEIWETKEDKLLSVNKLKEKNIEYARSHFIKTPHFVVENQKTKWKIVYASNKGMETKIAYQTANNGYQVIGRYDKNRRTGKDRKR